MRTFSYSVKHMKVCFLHIPRSVNHEGRMIYDMHMIQLESEAYVLYPDGNQYAYTPMQTLHVAITLPLYEAST